MSAIVTYADTRNRFADSKKITLDKINQRLGGGGGGVIIVGSTGSGTQQVFIDRDPLPPDDPTLPALSYPSAGGSMTQWSVPAQAWV